MSVLLLAVLLAQAGWSAFTAADGKASVAAPCVLVVDPAPPPPKKPGDRLMATSFFSCTTPAKDEYYFIAWVDYDPAFELDTAAELKANRDNTIKAISGATLLTSADATYQGNPALDFTANVQGRFRVTSRVVMAGRRPYQIAAMTPLDKDRSEAVRRFLDSLSIKN